MVTVRPEDLARLAALEELHAEKAVSLAANWPGDEADAIHHAGIVLALRTVRAALRDVTDQRDAMQRRAEAAEADWLAANQQTVEALKLARCCTNTFAVVARTKRDYDAIANWHREIDARESAIKETGRGGATL